MPQNKVDLDNLKMLQELLGDRFSELIFTYLRDSEPRLEALKLSYEKNDMNEVCHQAHSLKGSSRNLGIIPLVDLCEKLETQSRQNNVENGMQQIAAIEQEFAACVAVLKALV